MIAAPHLNLALTAKIDSPLSLEMQNRIIQGRLQHKSNQFGMLDQF